MAEEKEVMTAEDLAAYLGFSKNWIYRKAEAGDLPATKFGNRWRFKRSVIDRWVEEKIELTRVKEEIPLEERETERKTKASTKKRKKGRR